MNREQLVQALEAGATFEYVLFYGHTPGPDGRVGHECFSQWYAAPFVVGGVRYATAEHYMMAGKARLFDDPERLAEILAAPDPRTAKRLGRQVRDFDDAVWREHRLRLVVEGNVAKFGTSPLRDVLLATGDSVLVEAAPRDRIWGIGMGRGNPAATEPRAWRGLNLLGFALMEARAALRGARS